MDKKARTRCTKVRSTLVVPIHALDIFDF